MTEILKKLEYIDQVASCINIQYENKEINNGDQVLFNYEIFHYINENKVYLMARTYKAFCKLTNKEIKGFAIDFLDYIFNKRSYFYDLTKCYNSIENLSEFQKMKINHYFRDAKLVENFLNKAKTY